MKRYKVTDHVYVAVATIVEVEDGEELTEEEISERANGQFGGIENYAGFGDCDHLTGVSGDEDTIEASNSTLYLKVPQLRGQSRFLRKTGPTCS